MVARHVWVTTRSKVTAIPKSVLNAFQAGLIKFGQEAVAVTAKGSRISKDGRFHTGCMCHHVPIESC